MEAAAKNGALNLLAFGEESDVQDFLNERDVYCISNGITAESSTERI